MHGKAKAMRFAGILLAWGAVIAPALAIAEEPARFEPAALESLGGPPGTFVGHRLSTEKGLLAAAEYDYPL